MNLKEVIYQEMMVHVAMSTHKDPKDILFIGSSSSPILFELDRYSDIEVVVSEYIDRFEDKTQDVVIVDLGSYDSGFYKEVDRVLRDDGLMVVQSGDYFEKLDELRSTLKVVAEEFLIAMPFRSGDGTSILASKKYHPTADIILQRADFLEGLNYYNSDMQLASFVKPTSVHKALLGIAKN
jgi:spermidine synthase